MNMNWCSCRTALPGEYQVVVVWVRYENGEAEWTVSWIDQNGWAMGSARNYRVTHWMRIHPPNNP